MKKIWILLLALSSILISGCGDNNVIVSPASPNTWIPITIYALWDSITAWYQLPIEQSRPAQLGGMLQNAWYKNYEIINAWKSWDTSKQLKDRLDTALSGAKQGDIAILTIWWNDGLRSIQVATLEQNMRDIIAVLKDKWMNVVIGGMQIYNSLWSEYSSAFAEIYPKIARDTNSVLIPFILKWVALRPELNLPDMIHPNEAWYKIMAETVFLRLDRSNLINK